MSNTITAPEKFTKEIKENWLTALKSGNFVQGYVGLKYEDEEKIERHCCIGVLAEITQGLSNDPVERSRDSDVCPYTFLDKSFGEELKKTLWRINDKGQQDPTYEGHYKNVIPFIEELSIQD